MDEASIGMSKQYWQSTFMIQISKKGEQRLKGVGAITGYEISP